METTWRQYGDSLESDTFYEDFMAELIWRLSGNLIHHDLSIKIPD